MNNKSLVICKYPSGWMKFAKELGRIDYILWENKNKNMLIGKMDIIFESFSFAKYLIKNRKKISEYNSLILTSNETGYVGFLLSKFHVIKTKKVVLWGFYLHSNMSLKIHSILRWIIESKKSIYVLYSSFEEELYKNVFRNYVKVFSLPFGVWDPLIVEEVEEEDYYFAGGYSNRDYLPLIEAFRNRQEYKLLIIASKLNTELDTIKIPKNITILRDVNKTVFHEKMSKARGVIMPLKNNLGASGQLVIVNAMLRKKLIIINDNAIMKEYIKDKVNGLLVKNISRDLMEAIDSVEENPEFRERLKINSHQSFVDEFSVNPSRERAIRILNDIDK